MDVTPIQQYVEQFMAETGTPGVAVALTDRERLLGTVSCGYADPAAGVPVTPETLFPIGSVTKSFTALALMQQRDAGRFDPDAPITEYLPWFRVKSPYGPITGHHCLTHTAGLPNGRYDIPNSLYQVFSLRDAEVGAPPGEYWHYSNLGYEVLTCVLEAVSGKPYAAQIREGILDPLGMTASLPIITNDCRTRLAVGHDAVCDDRPEPRGGPLVPARWVELRSGDGSVASTAREMAAYVRMWLNGGAGPAGRIVSEDGFAQIMRRAVSHPSGNRYGYGLNVIEQDGRRFLAHNGNAIGYGAWMMADLTGGLGVVVLINGPARAYVLRNFAYQVLQAYSLGTEPPPVPRPHDPFLVPDAGAYTGSYTAGEKRVSVRAEGERLYLETDGRQTVPLEQRGPDLFHADHPAFRLALLRFGRGPDGEVAEAFHGPDWYVTSRYLGPHQFESPHEWQAYPGRYRSQHPWWNNFWIVLRKGRLVLVHPFAGEQPLIPLGGASFRVGEAARSPERISFDTIVDGRALRLFDSGCAFFRVADEP